MPKSAEELEDRSKIPTEQAVSLSLDMRVCTMKLHRTLPVACPGKYL